MTKTKHKNTFYVKYILKIIINENILILALEPSVLVFKMYQWRSVFVFVFVKIIIMLATTSAGHAIRFSLSSLRIHPKYYHTYPLLWNTPKRNI